MVERFDNVDHDVHPAEIQSYLQRRANEIGQEQGCTQECTHTGGGQ